MLSSPVLAADHTGVDHRGIYAGAGYGLVKAKGDDDFDDDNDALKLILGAQLTQVFSIEGSYLDFGKFGGNAANADVDGYSLAVKAGIPVNDQITLYAKGGQLWWDADIEVLGARGDTDGEELFFGAGLSLAVSRNMDIRFEYTRFNVEFDTDEIGLFAELDGTDTDLDYVNAAVQYNF
ncbi:MAG: porin family protein [Ketobacteraceae bacterium]|nr:porin family protein [Ketobacteraceae bacterium]